MSAEYQKQVLEDLEKVRSSWQKRKHAFQIEIGSIDGLGKRLEYQKEIQRCDEEIQKINTEIEPIKNYLMKNQLNTTQCSESSSSTLDNSERKPKIGIVTALPEEYAAVIRLLKNTEKVSFPGRSGGRSYHLGDVFTEEGGKHTIVLCLASMGNNGAAIRASLLLKHFPDLEGVIMVGIAGGIPYPEKSDDHVRLGDIVISNEKGVIQYDFDKETITETVHRHPPRPPSASLIEQVIYLQIGEMLGKKPWLKFIDQALSEDEQRPSIDKDILSDSTNPSIVIQHPQDSKRKDGEPRVFLASIASANKLLKNPIKRNKLRDMFGVKAVEMESSGIADTTWNYEIGYLVVRGICDYCDSNKNDDWRSYAAAVAAAYTIALLESIPVPKL
ncbi:MAG: 5'-methylthioadenosine/S-adenosylhomocysteine nucleosidase [Nostoc sp.]|uniref:5'-methylthioadenosine/S-adenosylhomocysteine nucleosidase family protein n=1 Tax=Nostoc sp. TaxID=1180 RepID=UPI002FFCAE81